MENIIIADVGGCSILQITEKAESYVMAKTAGGLTVCITEPPITFTDEECDYFDDVGYYPSTRTEKARMLEGVISHKPRTKPYSDKHDNAVKAARKTANENSWVGLKGTTKQKRWAEQIRIEVIPTLAQELAEFAGSYLDTATFWIDNRHNQKISDEELPKSFAELIVATKNEWEQAKAAHQQLVDKERAAYYATQQSKNAAQENLAAAINEELTTLFNTVERIERGNKQPLGLKLYELPFLDGTMSSFLNCSNNGFEFFFKSASEKTYFATTSNSMLTAVKTHLRNEKDYARLCANLILRGE